MVDDCSGSGRFGGDSPRRRPVGCDIDYGRHDSVAADRAVVAVVDYNHHAADIVVVVAEAIVGEVVEHPPAVVADVAHSEYFGPRQSAARSKVNDFNML